MRRLTLLIGLLVVGGCGGDPGPAADPIGTTSPSRSVVDGTVTTTSSPVTTITGFCVETDDLAQVVGGSIVAVVRDAREVDPAFDDRSDRRWWIATVEDVVFVASRENAPNAKRWRPLEPPPLMPGGTALLRDIVGCNGLFDFETLPSGRLLVVLTYAEHSQVEGEDPWYRLASAAALSEDGSLGFVELRYAESLDRQLDRFETALGWEGSDADLIVAWITERWFNADTGVDGPLDQAYQDL